MGALSEKVDISEVTQGGSNNTQQVAKTIINNYGTTPFNESKKLRASHKVCTLFICLFFVTFGFWGTR